MNRALTATFFFLLTLSGWGFQIYEPFAYPAGTDLNGQGGWVLSSGNSPRVQAGSLAVPGLMPSSSGQSIIFGGGPTDIRHDLGGFEDSGGYFYSAAFKVTELGNLSTNGDFIVAWSASGTNFNTFGGKLYLRKDSSLTNAYNIGISKGSDAPDAIVWSVQVFQTGQTNFVVCEFRTDGDSLLWINPDPSTYGAATKPQPDLVATGDPMLPKVGLLVLHQAAAGGPGRIVLDEIRAEGGWPHVTPVPLVLTNILAANGLDAELSWDGFQNTTLERATNLIPPVAWVRIQATVDNGSLKTYTDPELSSQRYYRLTRWRP